MNRRLLVTLFATVALTGGAFVVLACNDKTSDATSASATGKTSAVTASNDACLKAHGAAASSSQCSAHASAAMTAGTSGGCAHDGASTAKSASHSDACAMHATGVSTMANGCEGRGAAIVGGMSKATWTANEGGSCSAKTMNTMAANMACDACADMATCEKELKAAGSQYQVVPLKNGVMFVYTTDSPRNVRNVQTAIARRADRMNSIVTADNAKLCPDCKQMRGALASGKLTREVVNVEGGAISLVTSTDAKMVARLHEMAGLSATAKVVKS